MAITLQNVWDCASPSQREMRLYVEVGGVLLPSGGAQLDVDRSLTIRGIRLFDEQFMTLNQHMRIGKVAASLPLLLTHGSFAYPTRSQYTQISEDESGKHGAHMLVLSDKEPE